MKIFKHLFLFLFLSLVGKYTIAQNDLPQFEDPKKIEVLASDAEESMPLPYANSNRLYFVRTYIEGSMRQRKKGQEILLSQKEGSEWMKPDSDAGLDNDEGNNAIIGISNDGMRVYFFNSIQSHKKLALGLSYRDRYETGEWSDFKAIRIPNFEVGEGIYSFYFNSSEDVLLASIIKGVELEASSDLYVSLKNEDKTWTEFKHLGSVINTAGNEITPFIDEDNKTLYFSSTGHKGYGGADIFMSQRLDDSWTNWSNPVNLGPKINSENFDAYFLKTNTNEAFFASNRGQKYSDIYYTQIKEINEEESPKLFAQLYYNGETKEGINLDLFDKNDVKIASASTDEEGKFCCIPTGLSNFNLRMSQEDEDLYANSKVYLLPPDGELSQRLYNIGQGIYSDVEQTEVIKGKVESDKGSVKLNIYDEGGNFIKQVVTDENGDFVYTKLSADNNYRIQIDESEGVDDAELRILDPVTEKMVRLEQTGINRTYAVAQPKPVEEVKGKVKLKEGAKAGVKLNLYDEGGNFIKQVETDEHGDFSYTKLSADNNYIIEVDESEGFEDAEILILNPQTEKMALLDQSGIKKSLKLAKPKNIQNVSGKVKLKEGNTSGVKLNLYDEGGNFITQVETDEHGDFNYTKLSSEENYVIRIEGQDDAEIMLLDPATQKLTAMKKSSVDGSFAVVESDNPKTEKVSGVYRVNNIGLSEQSLLVKDENGFPIDMINTNNKGEFTFTKAIIDKIFTIQIQDAQESSGHDVELLSVDHANLYKEKLSGNIFQFSEAKLANLNPKITEKEAKIEAKSEVKKEEKSVSKEPIKAKPKVKEEILTNGEQPDKFIPFDFNTYYMRPSQRVQLNAVARKLRQNAQLNVEVIGHTDTSGTDEVNEDVSLNRAIVVKKYLVALGVESDRIKTKGLKDSQPIASNATRAGRIKNRRVEIFYRP